MNECLMINCAWAADTIAPAGMHVLCIAMRYIKSNKLENHKTIQFITFYSWNFDILNYKIFIKEFQYSVAVS